MNIGMMSFLIISTAILVVLIFSLKSTKGYQKRSYSKISLVSSIVGLIIVFLTLPEGAVIQLKSTTIFLLGFFLLTSILSPGLLTTKFTKEELS